MIPYPYLRESLQEWYDAKISGIHFPQIPQILTFYYICFFALFSLLYTYFSALFKSLVMMSLSAPQYFTHNHSMSI